MADVRLATPRAEPAAFEEVYLRFAPLLRKIAVGKFGIPAADAEPLVHDVFATYLTRAEEVEHLERYLIGGICNASRHYLRRGAAADDLFCGEEPCAATPTQSILLEVEQKILIGRMLARISARCRDMLYRYYVNGETTGCIAGELGFKPATVLIYLSKCRKSALSAYRTMTGVRS
jgi:DNA-directed RNA polymerase specialized sigma24 family protein